MSNTPRLERPIQQAQLATLVVAEHHGSGITQMLRHDGVSFVFDAKDRRGAEHTRRISQQEAGYTYGVWRFQAARRDVTLSIRPSAEALLFEADGEGWC